MRGYGAGILDGWSGQVNKMRKTLGRGEYWGRICKLAAPRYKDSAKEFHAERVEKHSREVHPAGHQEHHIQ